MRRFVVGCFVLLCGLCLVSGESQGAHCGGITDMYALAQCEASHTSASAAPGMIQSTIGSLPQYSGSPTCQTAGCSGAPQEGYFSSNGDVSALNDAGATAAATDSRMTDLQTTRTNVQGWNLTTSAPVLTSTAVAGSVTAPPVTTGCTDVTVCNAWSAATPSTQTCTVPGSALSTCTITVTPSISSQSLSGSVFSGAVGWCSDSWLYPSFTRVSPGSYQVRIYGPMCGSYLIGTIAVPEPVLAADESFQSITGSVVVSVYNYGGCPYAGSWVDFGISLTGTGPFYDCTANGIQSGVAYVKTWSLAFTIRKDTVLDGCSGQRATMTLQTSVCIDAAPRAVQDPITSVWTTLSPPTAFPANGCWVRNEQYGFQGTAPDTCGPLLSQNCSQIASVCTSPLPGGCDTYTNTMSCPGGSVCSAQTVVKQCSSCGTPDSLVPFCVDQTTPPNTNLANAATWLAMLDSIKNDWDPANLRIFTGKRMSCDYDTLGSLIVNCCDTDPSALIGSCTDEEIQLAKDRQNKKSHYVGDHCVTKGPFGICLRKEQVYCSYVSQLARMIHDQGQPQLGMSWGTADVPVCDGFTVTQFTAINWSLIDFSEWYANVSASIDPVGITNSMTTRICAATGSC